MADYGCPYGINRTCPFGDIHTPSSERQICPTCAFRESRAQRKKLSTIHRHMKKCGYTGPDPRRVMTRLLIQYKCGCGKNVDVPDGKPCPYCNRTNRSTMRLLAQGPGGISMSMPSGWSEDDFPGHDFVWAYHH